MNPALLDEALMLRTFEAHLLPSCGGSTVIQKCRRRWSKCQPSKGTFKAVYQVDLLDQRQNRSSSETLFLIMPGEKRMVPGMPEVGWSDSGSSPGRSGLPLTYLYLPDMQLLIQVFPTDLRLPQLRTLVDPTAVAPHLPGAEIPEITVLKYKPDKRCVIRYELPQNGENPAASPIRLIGKTFHDDRGREVFASLRLLKRSGIPVPEPLAYIPDLKLVLTEALRGEELGVLVGDPDFPAYVKEAARAVAGLHQIPVDRQIVETVTLAERAAKFGRLAERFQKACPVLGSRIEGLAIAIRERLEESRDELLTFVHGELDPHQMIVSDARIWFVDLDLLKASHPAMDVGRFLAHLGRHSLKEDGDAVRLEAAAQAFREEYQAVFPVDIRPQIQVCQAIEYVRLALREFRRQRPDWQSETARLLSFAEKALKRVRRGAAG